MTGALADPKIGPDPTETSPVDLLWDTADDGLRSRQKSKSHNIAIIVRPVKLRLNIQLPTSSEY